ncbi:MAG: hypothetical protein ACQERB_00845 [Promethearchaeati archaeon]
MKLLSQKINQKQKIIDKLIKRAKIIEKKGINSIDALHIASAEFIKCDYITTDIDIIKDYQTYKDFLVKLKYLIQYYFLQRSYSNGNEYERNKKKGN